MRTGGQGDYLGVLSTAIKPKLSTNSLLYTFKARGRPMYILKKILHSKKIRPSYENTHLWQLPDVDRERGREGVRVGSG